MYNPFYDRGSKRKREECQTTKNGGEKKGAKSQRGPPPASFSSSLGGVLELMLNHMRGFLKVARVDRGLTAFANGRGPRGRGRGWKVISVGVVGGVIGGRWGRRGGERGLRGVTVREGMGGVSQCGGLSFLRGNGPIKFTNDVVVINDMMVVRGGGIIRVRMTIKRPSSNVFDVVQRRRIKRER